METPYYFSLTGKWSVKYPHTLIDHIDVEGRGEWAGLKFKDYNWYVQRFSNHGGKPSFYVRATINDQKPFAHWFLTGKKGIDHADRDPFNNTSGNLREGTASEQAANRGIQRNNTSGLIGVSWHRQVGKWKAAIKVDSKDRYLGLFDDKDEAGRVRDKAAFEVWGYRTVLNFPDEMRVTA